MRPYGDLYDLFFFLVSIMYKYQNLILCNATQLFYHALHPYLEYVSTLCQERHKSYAFDFADFCSFFDRDKILNLFLGIFTRVLYVRIVCTMKLSLVYISGILTHSVRFLICCVFLSIDFKNREFNLRGTYLNIGSPGKHFVAEYSIEPILGSSIANLYCRF